MIRNIIQFFECICGIITVTSIVILIGAGEKIKGKFWRFMNQHQIVSIIYWTMCFLRLLYASYYAAKY